MKSLGSPKNVKHTHFFAKCRESSVCAFRRKDPHKCPQMPWGGLREQVRSFVTFPYGRLPLTFYYIILVSRQNFILFAQIYLTQFSILQPCVLSQTFYPNLPFFYTDISAISVTFRNSVFLRDGLNIWVVPCNFFDSYYDWI